jgi:hypothetical protein
MNKLVTSLAMVMIGVGVARGGESLRSEETLEGVALVADITGDEVVERGPVEGHVFEMQRVVGGLQGLLCRYEEREERLRRSLNKLRDVVREVRGSNDGVSLTGIEEILEGVADKLGTHEDAADSQTVHGRLSMLEARLTTIPSYTPAQLRILQILDDARIRQPIKQPLLQLMNETCGTINGEAIPGAQGTLDWVILGNGALSWPTTTFVQVSRKDSFNWYVVDRAIQNPGATAVIAKMTNGNGSEVTTSNWAIHQPWVGQNQVRELVCISMDGNWETWANVGNNYFQKPGGDDQCQIDPPMYDRSQLVSAAENPWIMEDVAFRAIKVRWTA